MTKYKNVHKNIVLGIIDLSFATNNVSCTNQATCNFSCNFTNACRGWQINASQADTLILSCNAVAACQELIITAPPQNNANIDCQYTNACLNATFNLNTTTDSISVICNETSSTSPGNPCSGATLLQI